MYYIYKITNQINQKCYIGFTNSPRLRWKNHRNCKDQKRKLYKAMKKYGKDNFTFEVIYEGEDRHHTLTVMEPKFIAEHNSHKHGYNCTSGGEDTNSAEHRERTRARMKSEENPMTKLVQEGFVHPNWFPKGTRRIPTEEEIQLTRDRLTGAKNHYYGVPEAADRLNKKTTCEVCGMITNKGNYKKWHGPNCDPKRTRKHRAKHGYAV